MKSTYLDLVHLGKNGWKQYFLAFLSFFLWLFICAIAFGLWGAFSGAQTGQFRQWFNQQPWTIQYLFLSCILISFIGLLYIITEKIHQRRLSSLAISGRKTDWKKAFYVFAIFFLIRCLTLLVIVILFPDNIQLNSDIRFWDWIGSLFFILPFTYLSGIFGIFRIGYFLQSFSLIIPSPYFLSASISLIFSLSALDSPYLFITNYLAIFLVLFLLSKYNCPEIIFGCTSANYLYSSSVIGLINKTGFYSPTIFIASRFSEPVTFLLHIFRTLVFLTIVILFKDKSYIKG